MSSHTKKVNPILEFVNVSKTYKLDRTSQSVIANLSLSISGNQSTAIMGPSGSGKSTLLNLAGLIETLDSGKIFFNKERVDQLSERKKTNFRRNKIGFIFQRFHLIPVLSAIENVLLPISLERHSNNKSKDYAMHLLNEVGLIDFAFRPASSLSGGQRQRVAIARALINNPELILADEPTANLDIKSGVQTLDLLFGLTKKQNRTLIIVSHDPNLAKRADEILYLRDGIIDYNIERSDTL